MSDFTLQNLKTKLYCSISSQDQMFKVELGINQNEPIFQNLLIKNEKLVLKEQNQQINFFKIKFLCSIENTSQFIICLTNQIVINIFSNEKVKIMKIILQNILDQKKVQFFPILFLPENFFKKNLNEEQIKENIFEFGEKILINVQQYEEREQIHKLKFQEKTQEEFLYSFNEKKVILEDFTFIKLLGKGAHGKVFLVKEKINNNIYAMKTINKKHIINKNKVIHTFSEKFILSEIKHPNIVQLKYSFQNESKIYFVMEFMKGGELFQHLKRVIKFKENQVKFFAGCIALALNHLHKNNFIYRDLKPENVLLDDEGYIKLTDFGLSKYLEGNDLATTFCGTPQYMAPEMILQQGVNKSFDWWSLGILLYELLCGLPPFYSTDIQKMYKTTIVKNLKFKKSIPLSEDCKEFIYYLLQKNPEERLGSIKGFEEIKNHPWFDDLDWNQLKERKIIPPYKPNVENWKLNFDQNFIKQKAEDSQPQIECSYEREQMDKEFENFDFDDLCVIKKESLQTTDDSNNTKNSNSDEKNIKHQQQNDFAKNLFYHTEKKQHQEKNYNNLKSAKKKIQFKGDSYSSKKHRTPFKFREIIFEKKDHQIFLQFI